MVDRISSASQINSLISNNLRLQSRYAEGQIQASSGYKSETYQGFSTDSRQILNLESDYKRTLGQTENAQQALSRTEVTFDALGSIIDTAQNFLANLNAAVSGTGVSVAELQTLAQTKMDQTASSLNVQLGGRYLFGGSATQTPPVDLNAVGYGGAVIPSTPSTLYYQGNDFVQSVEVDDGYTINYGVKADDPAIERLLRAFDLVRTNGGDQATLEEALTLLETGIDRLAETKASVSQDSQALNKRIDENLEDLNLLDNLIVDLKEVDLAEVSVRLKQLESQLQASYSVTTDLLRLNITDFL